MFAGVGYSDIPDSAAAGKQAVEKAIEMSGKHDPCDLVLLFCTARHNQRILRDAVSAVVGNAVPVYGGGAVGIITNDEYGYAGNQVGVACLWLDGVHYDAVVDSNLLDGEKDAGFNLGQDLTHLGVTPDSPVMLFYDAVSSKDASGVRLIMATWILEGLEKSLGFLPNLIGAGLMSDHACHPAGQYTGHDMQEHSAMALAFGGDIQIDSVILHGSRPASGYYTVTKAEGPVILEINHQPALTYIDEILGSVVAPERYPFFLLFGINSGERWGAYDEDQYANRMCLGIDRERNGIIMFEPDMVEGTEFQLMFRASDLDYMKPKFESAFDHLNGRKPVFALYIDCAGRCAGYEGVDIEDALVLQQVVANRVPVLGIYTGVEIAPVNGRPRSLDWTGVFCLFSQGGNEPETRFLPGKAESGSDTAKEETGINPPIAVLNHMCEQNAARILELDAQMIDVRYALELKRRGFRLLSELVVSLRYLEDDSSVFVWVAERINAALNMQKTVFLIRHDDGRFIPATLQGFTDEEQERLRNKAIPISDELLNLCPAIVTQAEDTSGRFSWIGEEYGLPFCIASPVSLQSKIVALLLTGRIEEQEPYLAKLGTDDMETISAITDLVGSILAQLRLREVTVQAETDSLTGLWNRITFQNRVERYLSRHDENSGAFMMIDIDHFKAVNDTYGHLSGDKLLADCADALRKVMRDSDFVGRQGGDEFVVFYRDIKDASSALKKADQIRDAWKHIVPDGGTGTDGITTSIGIALSPVHGKTFQALYRNADNALYQAKERGRDCCVLYAV